MDEIGDVTAESQSQSPLEQSVFWSFLFISPVLCFCACKYKIASLISTGHLCLFCYHFLLIADQFWDHGVNMLIILKSPFSPLLCTHKNTGSHNWERGLCKWIEESIRQSGRGRRKLSITRCWWRRRVNKTDWADDLKVLRGCIHSGRTTIPTNTLHIHTHIQCAAIKKTPLQNLQYLQICVIFLYENFRDY